MLIGLTGTFGSGKSTVSKMLEEMGAVVIDADVVARKVVEPGQPALEQIRSEFGNGFIGPDGRMDRSKMAAEVFADEQKRTRLNAIVHPPVIEEMERQTRELLAQGCQWVVWTVPLLLEVGMDKKVDRVVVVTIDDPERERRIIQRDGLTPRQIEQRVCSQWPQDQKVLKADAVIDNSGSLDHTRRQVEDLAARWKISKDKNRI